MQQIRAELTGYGDCQGHFRFCPAHDNSGSDGPMNSGYSLRFLWDCVVVAPLVRELCD